MECSSSYSSPAQSLQEENKFYIPRLPYAASSQNYDISGMSIIGYVIILL